MKTEVESAKSPKISNLSGSNNGNQIDMMSKCCVQISLGFTKFCWAQFLLGQNKYGVQKYIPGGQNVIG